MNVDLTPVKHRKSIRVCPANVCSSLLGDEERSLYFSQIGDEDRRKFMFLSGTEDREKSVFFSVWPHAHGSKKKKAALRGVCFFCYTSEHSCTFANVLMHMQVFFRYLWAAFRGVEKKTAPNLRF